MDRRNFIKVAALGTVSASSGNVQSAAAEFGIDRSIITAATTDPRVAELAAKFDFEKYLELLSDLTNPNSGIQGFTSETAPGSAGSDGVLGRELKPIDTGAVELLKEQTNARLLYNPFEVEYLLSSADSYVKSCLQLRQQAQEIEFLWLSSKSEILMNRAMQLMLEETARITSIEDNNVLGTMYKPVVNGQAISAPVTDESKAYFGARRAAADAYTTVLKIITDGKIAAAGQPGSGASLGYRFDKIKEEFDRILKEAYFRALAASFGLTTVYGISDLPLPPIEEIGYTTKLANWIGNALIRLERAQDKRSRSTLLMPVRKTQVEGADGAGIGLMSEDSFKKARPTGVFSFAVAPENLKVGNQQLTNVRMMGLEVFAWADTTTGAADTPRFRQNDFYRFTVGFPQNKIESNGAQVWTSNSQVVVPLASYPEGKLTAENRREVFNLDPIGQWSIQTDQLSYLGKKADADESLKNILIVMNVTHDAV